MTNVDTRVLFTKGDYTYKAYSIGVVTRQKMPKNDKYYTEKVIPTFLTKDGVPVLYIAGKLKKLAHVIADAFKPIDVKGYKIKFIDRDKQNCNFDNMQLIPTDSKYLANQFKYQVVERDTNQALGIYTAKQVEKVFGINANTLNKICDKKYKTKTQLIKYDFYRVANNEEE